jgi:membrane protein implicated in regulation of membrane protease activity
MLWQAWWIWVAAGLLLAGLELVIPGFFFLGFAVGAIATGVLLAFGPPIVSLPLALVLFALLSAGVWLVLQGVVGVRHGQIKRIDRDINEN